MDAQREAEELVRLWQELQEAQVVGDAARLERLRRRAEAEAQRAGASPEWALLASDAGQDVERLGADRAAQPVAGVGDDAVVVEAETAPEPVEGAKKRGRAGSLIWLAFLVGWVLLQIVQSIGGENGSP